MAFEACLASVERWWERDGDARTPRRQGGTAAGRAPSRQAREVHGRAEAALDELGAGVPGRLSSVGLSGWSEGLRVADV